MSLWEVLEVSGALALVCEDARGGRGEKIRAREIQCLQLTCLLPEM